MAIDFKNQLIVTIFCTTLFIAVGSMINVTDQIVLKLWTASACTTNTWPEELFALVLRVNTMGQCPQTGRILSLIKITGKGNILVSLN